MKFDLHIHSNYSFDSILSPEKIIRIAKKKGLDGVAVIDHNTIKGGVETSKKNDDNSFKVIIGSEIKTEYGDIIGLFLNEEIRSQIFLQVIEEIRDQGGFVILAHPFRKGINFPVELLKHIEFIEAFNSRSPNYHNAEALKLAVKYNKPVTAGSDAHFGFEIGGGRTVISGDFNNALEEDILKIEGEESNFFLVHGLSVGIEKIKMIRNTLYKRGFLNENSYNARH